MPSAIDQNKDPIIREQDKDPVQQLAARRANGGLILGKTGCNACDKRGYLVCKCPPSGGSPGEGGSEGEKSDPRKAIEASNKDNKTDTDKKENEYSPTKLTFYPLGNRLAEELAKDGSGTLFKALVSLDKIEAEFESFLQHWAEENATTVAELKALGNSAVINGDTITITITDKNKAAQFVQLLIAKNLIDPTPVQKNNHAEDANPEQNSRRQLPTPFDNPFLKALSTPELRRDRG